MFVKVGRAGFGVLKGFFVVKNRFGLLSQMFQAQSQVEGVFGRVGVKMQRFEKGIGGGAPFLVERVPHAFLEKIGGKCLRAFSLGGESFDAK